MNNNHLIDISAPELIEICGSTTYWKGRAYFEQNRVIELSCAVNPDDYSVTSTVRGSGNSTYQQQITLSRYRQKPRIKGACSCPVGFNCKHVVAVCLQLIAQKDNIIEFTPQNQTRQPDCLKWLENLAAPKTIERQEFIAYVISESPQPKKPLQLSIFLTKTKKQGGLTVGKKLNFSSFRYAYMQSQYSAQDYDIVQMMLGLPNDYYYSETVDLIGPLGAIVLDKLLKTGHVFWKTHRTGDALQEGPEKNLELTWQSLESSEYKLVLNQDKKLKVIRTDPPYYLDLQTHQLGLLNLGGMTWDQVEKIKNSPLVVPKQYAQQFSQRLLEKHPELPIPAPVEMQIQELKDITPRPVLELAGHSTNDGHYIHILKLHFDYDGHRLSKRQKNDIAMLSNDSGYYRLHRDLATEQMAENELTLPGFRAIDSEMSTALDQSGELIFFSPAKHSIVESAARWSHFLDEQIPRLIEQGWDVITDPSFLLQFQQAETWDAEIEQSDNDWFDMSFNITIQGRSFPLLPLITPVLESYDRDDLPDLLCIPLENHQFVNLPSEQLKPFLDILYELFDSLSFNDQGQGRFSRFNAAALVDLHHYGLFSINGGDELIEIGKKIRDFKGISDVNPPEGLQAELRNYQNKGLSWLQFLREYRFGGILADDMGLGKTIQTLAHLLLEKQSGRMQQPTLIVAPTSLMSNWRREAEKFTPELKVLVLQGTERKERFALISDYDLVLTTYPLLPRDEEVLLAEGYYYLILDEAQIVKNPKSLAARIVRRINAEHRLCLTGTPLENHLGELWAQYDFLMPGFLGDQTFFKKHYQTPIEVNGDPDLKAKLSKRLEPFLLRRTKKDVVEELPDKTEMIRSVPLYDKQAALYESIRISMEKKVRDAIAEKGLARSHITILDALLKLRQTCCDPRTLNLAEAKKVKESAKLDLLMELIPELLEEGRKILLFSQFTKMLALIETELKAQKISYTKLTGQTRKRDEVIEQFKSGQVDLFLISLKAGGVGLNLTEADTVIIYDPWWNPAVEAQAADRAHRIGQDKAVFVYKLITENTVEEKILAMQEKKRRLSESIYQGGKKEAALQLTADDLTDLFTPLA
jgi:superfamily II DNA or RNA helicase